MPSVVAQIRQEGAVTVDYDPNRAHGGKTVYGACVGILMLETRFPRIPGDIGHAAARPFPVLYRVVRGATGARHHGEGERSLDRIARRLPRGRCRAGARRRRRDHHNPWNVA